MNQTTVKQTTIHVKKRCAQTNRHKQTAHASIGNKENGEKIFARCPCYESILTMKRCYRRILTCSGMKRTFFFILPQTSNHCILSLRLDCCTIIIKHILGTN